MARGQARLALAGVAEALAVRAGLGVALRVHVARGAHIAVGATESHTRARAAVELVRAEVALLALGALRQHAAPFAAAVVRAGAESFLI